MTPEQQHRVLLVSDGTGETAAQMIKAAMVQFQEHLHVISRHKNIRTETQIQAICDQAAIHKDLIIFTIVSPNLKQFLLDRARAKQIPCVDLLGPLLAGLSNYFGYKPKFVAGLLHDINENYFRRIDAMEYTIAHDDGRDLTGLERADLVILGISRTSKTPLSMYLSHQGWRIANIPLIRGFDLPREIQEIDQRKIVGLLINPEELARIRRARLGRLGQEQGGDYADLGRVTQEIEYANEIFKKNRRWPIFNVAGKALEETASEIIKLMGSRNLLPEHSITEPPPNPKLIAGSQLPASDSLPPKKSKTSSAAAKHQPKKRGSK